MLHLHYYDRLHVIKNSQHFFQKAFMKNKHLRVFFWNEASAITFEQKFKTLELAYVEKD